MQLKAAMLLNFARFTSFPSQLESSVNFCFYGESPFIQRLSLFADETVHGVSVNARVIENLDEASQCNLMFIGSNQQPRIREILKTLESLPILTIGEMPDFAKMGGTINLINVGTSVRFRINHKASEKRKVNISSRLLRIATLVESD